VPHADGLPAHAVAHEVDLVGGPVRVDLAPRGVQPREVAAVSKVAELGRVLGAVVDLAAFDLRVQLAGAVPITREGAHHRRVDRVSQSLELFLEVALQSSPVLESKQFVATPAREAVDQYDRVRVVCGRCAGSEARSENQRDDGDQQRPQMKLHRAEQFVLLE
jgi:hypothetical protein